MNMLIFPILLALHTASVSSPYTHRTGPRSMGANMSDAPPDSTVVTEGYVRLILPGRWTKIEQAPGGPTVYRLQGHQEQITITQFSARARMSPTEQASTLDGLIAHHKEAESRAASGELTFSPVGRGQIGQVLAARWTGFESRSNYRFATLLLCSPLHAAVLYFEASGVSEAEFGGHAKAIFNRVAVE